MYSETVTNVEDRQTEKKMNVLKERTQHATTRKIFANKINLPNSDGFLAGHSCSSKHPVTVVDYYHEEYDNANRENYIVNKNIIDLKDKTILRNKERCLKAVEPLNTIESNNQKISKYTLSRIRTNNNQIINTTLICDNSANTKCNNSGSQRRSQLSLCLLEEYHNLCLGCDSNSSELQVKALKYFSKLVSESKSVSSSILF